MNARTRPWRGGLSIVSAVLLTLAHPPWSHGWLAAVALVPLLVALPGLPAGHRFLLGWLCGTVWSLALVGAWLAPAAGAALEIGRPAALAVTAAAAQLYGGLHVGLFALLAVPSGAASPAPSAAPRRLRPLSVAAVWVGVELLRSASFGGIPWCLLGHALWNRPALIQPAALAGVAAVSFWLALVNAALAASLLELRGGAPLRRLATALATVALVAGYGHWRLAGEASSSPTASVRVVYSDWRRLGAGGAEELVAELARNSRGGAAVGLTVWPEAAVRFDPLQRPPAAHALYRLAGELGGDLMFGAPRSAAGAEYNSVYVVRPAPPSPEGRAGDRDVVGFYDKRRLVPFAEARFTPGESARALPAGGRAVLPLICFEALFADLALAGDPDLLINPSNDARLGAGAAQQAAMAVFRAVENGIPLLRVANRGPSLLVDGHGRIGRTASGWGAETWPVPQALPAPPYRRVARQWRAAGLARAAGDGVLAWGCLVFASWRAVQVWCRRRTVVRAEG